MEIDKAKHDTKILHVFKGRPDDSCFLRAHYFQDMERLEKIWPNWVVILSLNPVELS